MSNPFKLEINNRPNAHTGGYLASDPMKKKVYEFMRTQKLDLADDYDLRFQVETTLEKMRKYDVIGNNTPIRYLFGPKAMDILMQLCPDQIQVFNTVVKCKDGDLTEYKALNILNAVDVSNPEKSVYDYISETLAPPGTICGYDKCVFKENCMGDIHIARDAKCKSIIIVSETLKNALEKAKVKGFEFVGRGWYSTGQPFNE